jgi:ATP-binding cassette subfamily B protein
MRLVRLWGLFFPLVRFLAGVTTLILLRFGGAAILRGDLSAGEFVATLSYLEMLLWPMIGAGFTVNMIQRGGASLGRVNRVLEEEPEITDPAQPVPPPERRDIEVRSLTFAYGDDDPVLRDLSFEVADGGVLGILGRTASGKTTLVNLMPRMLDTPSGAIYVGGTDITKIRVQDLRRMFAVVPQDTFLFSATIKENIAFAMDGKMDEELIQEVAEISTITRDMKLFPDGWETEVGERGITLSGGQKQRVAISRALASGSDILILDDALSAVDTETEEQILGSLLSFRKGKTTIIISHRVSTLQFADTILVLEDGRITQSGTHGELVKQEGFYSEIYELQRLESIGGAADA